MSDQPNEAAEPEGQAHPHNASDGDLPPEPTGPPRGSRIDPYRELVGVLTDSEVAAKAGVSSSAVHQYRNRLGIAPALPQGTTRRALDRRKEREAHGTPSPAPKRKKRPVSVENADDVIALHVDQLGRAPDREVAAQIGATADAVRRFREKLGIGAFPETPSGAPSRAGARGKSKLDPYRHLVGVLSDSDVAKRAGLTRSAVQMFRRTHGIAAASLPGGPRSGATPSPAPAVERAATPRPTSRSVAPSSGGSYAWLIRFSSPSGEKTRVALASDAAEACRAASASGEVVSVERLAEAL